MKDSFKTRKFFRIEKDVKIWATDKSGAKSKHTKYPFKTMEVGDSFIFGDYSRDRMRNLSAAARAWKNVTHREKWQFACRKTEKNLIRIWRIK